MMRIKSIRPTVAVVIAAVIIVAAGGAAVASNMGFKMNKPLVLVATGQTGNNWTSIPFHNPYGTFNQFCTQTGLKTTLTATQLTVRNYRADTDGFKSCNCGFSCNTDPYFNAALVPGKMIQIKAVTGTPTSIIIVGSHNSGQTLTVTEGVSFWYSVPYHTTAVDTDQLCAQIGLTSSGIPKASITRLNPGPPAAFQTTTCGNPATKFNLVLGEGLQLTEANPASPPGIRVINFTPAHY